MIKHNVYPNGVQSLAWVDENQKVIFSVGIVPPGEYDFGQAAHKETIRVIESQLVINGQFSFDAPDQDTAVVQPGEEIRITADLPASYHCLYGD